MQSLIQTTKEVVCPKCKQVHKDNYGVEVNIDGVQSECEVECDTMME